MKKLLGCVNGLVIFGALSCCCLLFVGCCRAPHNVSELSSEVARLRQELDNQKNELRSLARVSGIPESQINSQSAIGLISEIRIKLENSNGYYGHYLSDKDMEILKDLLADEPQMEKIIQDYDAFIKQNKGKRIITFP